MNKVLALALLASVMMPGALSAGARIYLYQKVTLGDGPLTLGDIAGIEAGADEFEKIRGLAIDETLYGDGLIDRSEVIALLKKTCSDTFCIFGTGVRVEKRETAGSDDGTAVKMVKQGTPVVFILVKNGIRIEVRGKMLKSGMIGDIVPVRLDRMKNVEGTLTGPGEVELCL